MDIQAGRTELIGFREELRAWLSTVERPEGLRNYGATPTAADVGAGRRWQAVLAEAGYACISWPVEHGGRGASFAEQAVFAEECARAGVPRQFHFIGPELVGPVLIAHGTDAQRPRWLPPLRSGAHMWCQLFSEPDAGSDLASLRTTATAHGDVWVVDGRKVWSSGASVADFGLLLARTGPDRLALTMFAVPMTAAGVEVRPIRQMDGDSRFSEITFDQVQLPADALIGGVGDGWKVAMTTLGNERVNIGGQAVALFAALEQVLSEAGRRDAVSADEGVRLWIRIWLLRFNFERLLASGRPASDPRYSMLKLTGSELGRDLSRFAMDLLGCSAVAGEAGLSERSTWFLAQPGQTLAGGTSEVQRNILSERVLGLPR